MKLGWMREGAGIARCGAWILVALLLPLRGTPQPQVVPMMNHFPGWSPVANLIVFDSDRDGDSEIWLIEPDSGAWTQLTDNRAWDGGARWTRDGQFILFQSDRDGTVKTYRMRRDGSDQRLLAGHDERIESVAPDGRTRLRVDSRGTGSSVVVRVEADGGETQLTRGSWASQPSFSQDSEHIVFEDREGEDVAGSHIVLMRRDGAERRVLALGTDPSWSPDGGWILFKTPSSCADGFGWEITTVRPDGSSLRRLTPGVHPSWSPDGARIAFMRETSPHRSDMWVISSGGAEARCLTCAF